MAFQSGKTHFFLFIGTDPGIDPAQNVEGIVEKQNEHYCNGNRANNGDCKLFVAHACKTDTKINNEQIYRTVYKSLRLPKHYYPLT